MIEVVHRLLKEVALRSFESDPAVIAEGYHLLQVTDVFTSGFGVHYDIVYVDDACSPFDSGQDHVHRPLKGGRGIE